MRSQQHQKIIIAGILDHNANGDLEGQNTEHEISDVTMLDYA